MWMEEAHGPGISRGQRVEPQAEPLADEGPDWRGSDHQRFAHRDLHVSAIPERTPSAAEEPVTICVKECRERFR